MITSKRLGGKVFVLVVADANKKNYRDRVPGSVSLRPLAVSQ